MQKKNIAPHKKILKRPMRQTAKPKSAKIPHKHKKPSLNRKAKNKPTIKKSITYKKKKHAMRKRAKKTAKPKAKIKIPKKKSIVKVKEFMKTGIDGLDALLEKGVPKGAS
ncbi:MAG: hypothetical protein V1734_05205, partial [Nanoarchaeota archaeon]